MINDHTSNNQQTLALAAQKGITIYTFQPATYEVAAENYLAALGGTVRYSPTFMQLELQDHQDTLQRLQSLQNQVTDPDIKNLIAQTIPIIQNHIQLASAGGTAQPGGQPPAMPSASPSP